MRSPEIQKQKRAPPACEEGTEMLNRFGAAVPAFAAASAIACALLGWTNLPAAPSSATLPQKASAATAPDLSGVWITASGVYDYAAFSNDEPPMTAAGRAQYEAARPSQGPRGVKLEETNDRVYKCSPPGVPYIYIQIFPMQIIQTPREVIEFFEYDHTVRYIYTDGREHPANLKPSYNGHSIGHWEGDTLVVDTIGLNGKNWLDRLGHPESSRMHIVERIRRVDEKTLQIQFMFDDPANYTKPWAADVGFRLHPEWDILEHVCEDNLAFESFEH
jgi:hypothetical protein